MPAKEVMADICNKSLMTEYWVNEKSITLQQVQKLFKDVLHYKNGWLIDLKDVLSKSVIDMFKQRKFTLGIKIDTILKFLKIAVLAFNCIRGLASFNVCMLLADIPWHSACELLIVVTS